MPRVVADLCARVAALPAAQQRHTTLECSFLEIYNEQLYDLLEPYKQALLVGAKRHDLHRKRLGLRIREDASGFTSVPQAAAIQVRRKRSLRTAGRDLACVVSSGRKAGDHLQLQRRSRARLDRTRCCRCAAPATCPSCCGAATPTGRSATQR